MPLLGTLKSVVFLGHPYLLMAGVMFSLCFFFTFLPKLDSGPWPNLREGWFLPGKNWGNWGISVMSVEGFWRNVHFTRFIMHSLTNQQPLTKTRLKALGIFRLGPHPKYLIIHSIFCISLKLCCITNLQICYMLITSCSRAVFFGFGLGHSITTC